MTNETNGSPIDRDTLSENQWDIEKRVDFLDYIRKIGGKLDDILTVSTTDNVNVYCIKFKFLYDPHNREHRYTENEYFFGLGWKEGHSITTNVTGLGISRGDAWHRTPMDHIFIPYFGELMTQVPTMEDSLVWCMNKLLAPGPLYDGKNRECFR